VRLFAAVNLPPDLRQAIHAAAAPLRDANLPVKWVEPEGVHLTLKFLGDVTPDRLPDLAAAVDRACAGVRAFSVLLEGFGAFPAADRARVVWLGCEAAPPLELLQHAVEREYAALGFPVEGRPFRPHLTLGRARPRGGVRGLETPLEATAFAASWSVTAVDLMESTLSRAGARYTPRHHVPLAERP
jgi:2'-5' RNA ligase